MSADQLPRGGAFFTRAWFLRWIGFTTLGQLVGLALATGVLLAATLLQSGLLTRLPVQAADNLAALRRVLSFLLSGAVLGAACGAGQWLVLRRLLPRMPGWIAASALGSGLAAALAPSIGLEIPPLQQTAIARIIPGTLTVLVGGLAGGAAQWLVLRGKLPRARWWVVVNALSWTTGGLLFFAGFAFLTSRPIELPMGTPLWIATLIALLFAALTLALVPAILSGWGLWALLRREDPQTLS